ncbi:helix-turn-helix transcriptional regulator [Halocatena halophila]|uniref:helix-turn-helix transcriptional regulator n=1 Tax=Halocatena halophila TaxID=2814576 RepID=UPI002ED2665D
MEETLEEIEFLVRSENRIAVLRLLANEGHTRSSLATATGVSQATLSRILRDFVDRSWITRRDGQYVATATGELLAEGLTEFLDLLELEADLRPVVEHLPTDRLSFPLGRLVDATVVLPSATRPDAPVGRLLELERTADEIQAFSFAFNERSLELVVQRVTDGTFTFDAVLSPLAIEALSGESELRELLIALIEADGASIRVTDATIPLAVTVADETVHLLVRDDDGVLRASIDTDDATVRSWAVQQFESHWENSRPLDRSSIA